MNNGVGAEPPFSVTQIDPEFSGFTRPRWYVMGTVAGDPRSQCGPVAFYQDWLAQHFCTCKVTPFCIAHPAGANG